MSTKTKPAKVAPITCADDVATLLARAAAAPQEEFWVIPLDAKHRPIRRAMVARGTANRCWVHPRDVFRVAVRANAVAVIVAHNHPSGDVTPSADDVQLTSRFVEAGALLGIPVVDHVIVGNGEGGELTHYSFQAAGRLPAASVRAAA